MPVYEYLALNDLGKKVKGSVSADNLRLARQKLRSTGIFPSEIREGKERQLSLSGDLRGYFQESKISLQALAFTTRQLSTLLTAGIPLTSALTVLTDQSDSAIVRRTMTAIREQVEQGASLAKTLRKYSKSFPNLYINMVEAGEATGNLDAVLTNLADYLEAQLELRRNVRSALMYPCLMLSISLLVIMGLFVFVIPKIVDIFKKQNIPLPIPTTVMIYISNFLVNYWWVLILVGLGSLWGIQKYYQSPRGREQIDHWLLRVPIFGILNVKIATARFSSTLGTMLLAGVDLLQALEIAKNLLSNIHLQRVIEQTIDGVREGKSLAKELSRDGYFPSMLIHMVAIGEKSGAMEQMLSRAGKTYENEVNATIGGLTTLLNPLMMLIVGGIVFAIVISVLLPMTGMMDALQRPG